MKLIQVILKNDLSKKNLSIREASRQIGIAHTTLARVVEGHAIDLDTHIKICDWLEIKPSSALDAFDLPPQYVPISMIVQPIEFEKVAPGLKRVQVGDNPMHCAV